MSTILQGLTNERVPQEASGRPAIKNFHKLPLYISSRWFDKTHHRLVEITVITFVLVVVLSNLLPKAVESKGGSLLFGNFNNNNNIPQLSEEWPSSFRPYLSFSLASLAQTSLIATQSNGFSYQAFDLSPTIRGNVLINPSNPLTTASGEPRDEIITYQVQEGDNPSIIAASFGITTNTLLWANNLGFWDYIRPRDELKILPISGLVHQVKRGDTVESIAKKYKADSTEIISFNGLPADGSIESDQELVIPDGVKFTPRPRIVYASYSPTRIKKGHIFPWGQCTWYLATKRYVPWAGNANQWLFNAKAYGFEVCWGSKCTPQVGAIVELKGSSWLIRRYGHVAYVEKVTSTTITISEMNFIGLGVKSVRVLSRNSRLIKGYIY